MINAVIFHLLKMYFSGSTSVWLKSFFESALSKDELYSDWLAADTSFDTPVSVSRYSLSYMQRRSMWAETSSSRARFLKAFQSLWCSVPWSNLCSLFSFWFHEKVLGSKEHLFLISLLKQYYLIYSLLLFLWKQKSGGGDGFLAVPSKRPFPLISSDGFS